ncbi:42296_t:CDS:2 [Gigaspora margarita]|uniref:42296_t:CDS:1 n=1 Tax=Gigaspora margarita TaxID=4874 RepID=A0ABN7UC33_GIGMA|nr:42296_t:CDS:2 [Gigaspora margarita]
MSLFCIVLVDPLTGPFAVDIAEKNLVDCHEISIDNLTIWHLKKLIWKQNQYDLADINPATLTLWKVEGLNERNRKWEIFEKKSHTEIDIKQEFGGEKLFSTMKFKEAFPVKLPDNTIHIIVQLPRKRNRDDSDEKGEGQESKKVKLVATASKIMESIMKLPDICDVYSDPKNFLSLPFPYPGSNKPVDRFAIDGDGFFTFMGRKKFNSVLDKIKEFRSSTGYMKMFIYGTVGYGKSHILTAIACFLIRIGKRVVYLPDCRELAVDPMEYIKSALFLTYMDDDAKTSEINACESFDQIIKFCRSLDETLYFIVDQMNALDDYNYTGISPEEKRQVKKNIDKLCLNHFYIKSSSANNHAVLHLKQKQTNEKKITLYGGFDEEEMEEWWKKHNSVLPTMDNWQKDQIEDITGKIPLFLNVLLESDRKNFEDALGYLDQQLIPKIKEPMTNFSDNIPEGRQEFHVKLMSSFLTKGYPPSGYGVSDIDHRFFYIENELCHYVCGVARDCMADYLYEKKRMEMFTDIKWISCIEKFKNNPSVKGFFAEKACIASIFKNGIMANRVTFKPNDIEFFCDEKEIRFSSNEGKCILYLPRRWNQEAIDGLLISKTNNKLYVAPIQITLDKSGHSDSEGIFFSNIWPNLKSTLSGLEDGLEIIFIWITSESDTDVAVEINSRKTRNQTFEINPDYARVVMGFGNVNKDIDRYLS